MKWLLALLALGFIPIASWAQDFEVAHWGDSEKAVYAEQTAIPQIGGNMTLLKTSPNELQYGLYYPPNQIWIIYSFTDDKLSSGMIIINDVDEGDTNYLAARYQFFLQFIQSRYGKPAESINHPGSRDFAKAKGRVLAGWTTDRSLIYFMLTHDQLGRWTQYQLYVPKTADGKRIVENVKSNLGFQSSPAGKTTERSTKRQP